jgi:hypothetical protein
VLPNPVSFERRSRRGYEMHPDKNRQPATGNAQE